MVSAAQNQQAPIRMFIRQCGRRINAHAVFHAAPLGRIVVNRISRRILFPVMAHIMFKINARAKQDDPAAFLVKQCNLHSVRLLSAAVSSRYAGLHLHACQCKKLPVFAEFLPVFAPIKTPGKMQLPVHGPAAEHFRIKHDHFLPPEPFQLFFGFFRIRKGLIPENPRQNGIPRNTDHQPAVCFAQPGKRIHLAAVRRIYNRLVISGFPDLPV